MNSETHRDTKVLEFVNFTFTSSFDAFLESEAVKIHMDRGGSEFRSFRSYCYIGIGSISQATGTGSAGSKLLTTCWSA